MKFVLLGAALSLLASTHSHATEPYLVSRLANLPQYNGSLRDGGVALYGSVDLGINYQKIAGHSRTMIQSGGELTSKLGIFARENLGNGLRVETNLEGGFQADTGELPTPGVLFNRESWIGLSSTDYGTLRAGKQLPVSLPLFVDVFGTVGTNSVYTWVGMGVMQTPKGLGFNSDLGPGATQVATRVNNSLKWISPRWNGFGTEMLYAFNKTNPDAPNTSNRGILLNHLRGSLYLAASYNQVWSTPVELTPGQARQAVRNDIYGAGAVYDSGELVLSTAYSYYKPQSDNHGVAHVYSLGVLLPYDRHTWRLSAVYRDTSGARDQQGLPASSSAVGVMLGYDYELSKRTAIYARAGKVHNSGISTTPLNNNPLPTRPGSTDPLTGTRPMTASVGMYHSF